MTCLICAPRAVNKLRSGLPAVQTDGEHRSVTGARMTHDHALQAENVFYRDATFFSAGEVEQLLHDTGFTEPVWVQTLSKSLEATHEIEPLHPGYGNGAFVVVRAQRPE